MARLVGGHRDAIITQKKKQQCKAPSSSGHFIRYPVPARCTGQLQWVVSIRVNQGLAFRKETKDIQSIQFTGFLHLFYWPVKNQHTDRTPQDTATRTSPVSGSSCCYKVMVHGQRYRPARQVMRLHPDVSLCKPSNGPLALHDGGQSHMHSPSRSVEERSTGARS